MFDALCIISGLEFKAPLHSFLFETAKQPVSTLGLEVLD
jgi:hypothetical protein